MWINKCITYKQNTLNATVYGQLNKWFLPFGLNVWNRHSTNKTVYYKHLIEVSIGILCFRFVFQWWN